MTVAVTVAAIIEQNGRFLVVEERDALDGGHVLNQPAGHVEPGESVLDAVVRESFEEAGVAFVPEAITGIYQLAARNGRDYLRIAFAGRLADDRAPTPHDSDILACHWLTRAQIAAARPRSGLVLRCIDDHIAGTRLPLSLLASFLCER